MSQGGQRPPANRMTLQTFKFRLSGAKKGHSLLKKKRDALKARFQALLKDIVTTKMEVGQGLKDAAFGLAKAYWANSGDDITSMVVERARKPSLTCKLTADNVAGVSLPKFTVNYDATVDASAGTMSVAHGGAVLGACRGEYVNAVKKLVHLATLQTSFKTLDEEIKMTSRRVNALEYVLIPRIETVCAYIILEMDEESREEFFRVKKVVEKKKMKLAKERLEEAKYADEKLLRAARVTETENLPSSDFFRVASRQDSDEDGAAGDDAPDATPQGCSPQEAPGGASSQGGGKKKKGKKKGQEQANAFDAPSALPAEKDPDVVF